MGKVKSAICLTFMTLLVAVLCFVCLVSFSYGENGMYTYNSILAMTQKDADLGSYYGSGDEYSMGYYGGGYSAVYYPEGVISAKEYEDNLAGYAEESDKKEYAEKYTKFGSLYFENEVVSVDENGEPDAEFKANFASALKLMTERYEALHGEDVEVSVVDDYTIRVFTPRGLTAAFTSFAYTGELTVSYGSDESSAELIMPANTATESIRDYVKTANVRTRSGSYFVVIVFTNKGKAALATATADAESSSGTVFFKVGDHVALQLSATTKIDQRRLYISSTSFTQESASASAILIDSALNGTQTELQFSFDANGSVVADIASYRALYGDSALFYLYIAFAVCFVAMMVFFFVRYHLLAFAHLYTYLIFLCATILCVWAIPFLTLSVETVAAVLLTSVLLSVSNAIAFENAKKEYALGKTMTSSVKSGYKKSLWHVFDLHIALVLAGFITFAIALAPLSTFAFTFGLTAVFSGLGSLVLTRFNWAIMMEYTRNKGGFCNFKKEVEDDE